MIDEKRILEQTEQLKQSQFADERFVAGVAAVEVLIEFAPKVGEWIPIKFRETTDEDGLDKEEHPIMLECPLPDDGEEVLVATKLGHVVYDTFYDDDGACLECCEWDEITAWMPLPPVFEGNKE